MGLNEDTFWSKTPRLINLVISAKAKQLEREQNGRAWLAWHIAALSRVKKLPDLDKLLVSKNDIKRQTPKEILEAIKMIHVAYGGTLPVKKRKK